HEYRVRVMPSVAGSIVRWCWQTPARTANSPVWLPFQIHAVAGGTMTHIQAPPKSDLVVVIGINVQWVRRHHCFDQADTGPDHGHHDDDACSQASKIHFLSSAVPTGPVLSSNQLV